MISCDVEDKIGFCCRHFDLKDLGDVHCTDDVLDIDCELSCESVRCLAEQHG